MFKLQPQLFKFIAAHSLKYGLLAMGLILVTLLLLEFFKTEETSTAIAPPPAALEGRTLEASGPNFHAIFTPGTSPEIIKKFMEQFPEYGGKRGTSENQFTFNDTDRWFETATDVGPLFQGDPMTLTWSFIPEGTLIPGFNPGLGEVDAPSNLIAYLDSIYGAGPGGPNLTQRPWFPLFQQIFDNWGTLTGITYKYEPTDDGATFGDAPGVIGVRGDVRIGGHTIDGSPAGGSVLAYNFFPNVGDMVIDTADLFYFNTGGNSLGLRNVLSHEHGHGLGIKHVCPVNETKLMEPFVSFNFDGPQPDDILAANRGYGDSFEPNDTSSTAHSLGTLNDGTTPLNISLSIDDNTDNDFFSFTIANGKTVSLTVTPSGSTYLSGSQLATGACTAGTPFNAVAQSNLSLQILSPNGSTVLATANATGLGGSETISNLLLTTPGTYFVKVTGVQNVTQLYAMQFTATSVGASITKSANPLTPNPGNPITFTLKYVNRSNLTLTNVVITDIIPIQITKVVSAYSGSLITRTPGITFAWQVAPLAPGAEGTITLTGVISPGVPKSTIFTNTTTIIGTGGTNTTKNSAAVTIYIGGSITYLPVIFK